MGVDLHGAVVPDHNRIRLRTLERGTKRSGLATPGLILMGLALIGGGVATTAGGVKLLRVFALYQNGTREMEAARPPAFRQRCRGGTTSAEQRCLHRLDLLHALRAFAGGGHPAPHPDRDAFRKRDRDVHRQPVHYRAAVEYATDAPIRLIELTTSAKLILCGAMVLGRLETLAIIALVTPDLWLVRHGGVDTWPRLDFGARNSSTGLTY